MVYDHICSHKSIRSYKETPIPNGELDKILEAATRASTSGNIQPYSIIITKNPENRAELYELHHRQEMILQAPLLLTFCTDWNRMTKWCELNNAKPTWDNLLCFLVGTGDVFIAAQNAALTAESFGLGICYMGTTLNNAPKLAKYFECPKGVIPVTTLVIGYPDEDLELRGRLPIKGILHEEKYQDYSDSAVAELYQEKEAEGWNRYMAYPDLKAKIEEAGVTNLAQVYTDVKYTANENADASKAFLELLKEKDYL
ncbi:MAG: nitroreductase family protein [Flavobacteriales bacterium]|nr:nitroreductase family protein [Flavobacteriales bacterium]